MATITAQNILGKLQRGYDVVKPKAPRQLAPSDHLIDDLELDSLDFIDLLSVLEGDFSAEVLDAIIDQASELRTVGDVVDRLAAVT